MTSVEDIYPDNVPGLYFVDTNCISCDTCTGIAKHHFKLTDDFDHAIVFKQPTTPDETARCEDALVACPVLAIGRRS